MVTRPVSHLNKDKTAHVRVGHLNKRAIVSKGLLGFRIHLFLKQGHLRGAVLLQETFIRFVPVKWHNPLARDGQFDLNAQRVCSRHPRAVRDISVRNYDLGIILHP